MIRRPPRSTLLASSAASDVYMRQYYIYMEVVTADKEHPENKGIQIIDLATKKAYNDRYFLWHSKKGIFTQEKVCEDYRTMLIFGK